MLSGGIELQGNLDALIGWGAVAVADVPLVAAVACGVKWSVRRALAAWGAPPCGWSRSSLMFAARGCLTGERGASKFPDRDPIGFP